MIGLLHPKGLRVMILSFSIFFLAGGLGILPGSIAWAEDQKGIVLTLEEAVRTAMEKNKDIQKAKEYRNLVEGRYIEERAAALPQLALSGKLRHSRDESQGAFLFGLLPLESEVRGAEIGLSQAIFTYGQVGAAIRAAKVGLATADDQLRIFRQAAQRDVSQSFYDILLAKELFNLAKHNLEQKKRHLDEARKKFSAGTATEYDVLAAEVEVENANPEVFRNENLVRLSKEKLRFLLGLESQEIDVEGSLVFQFTHYPPYEEALQIAKKNRPELADLQKRVEIAKELVKIANAQNKPRVDLKAAYGWQELIQGSDQASGQAWSAGLFLTFPFFDGLRTQGKVVQAKSDVTSLKIDETKLLDSIYLQIRDTNNFCREAEEIVKALSGTVTQAERLLFMAEKGFEYGVKTKLDVDDAALNLIRVKGNLAKGRRDYLVARVTYDWVMGIIGEKGNP